MNKEVLQQRLDIERQKLANFRLAMEVMQRQATTALLDINMLKRVAYISGVSLD